MLRLISISLLLLLLFSQHNALHVCMQIGCIDWCAITGFSLWLYDAIVANRCRAEKLKQSAYATSCVLHWILVCAHLPSRTYVRRSNDGNTSNRNRNDRISTLIDYFLWMRCVSKRMIAWMWSINFVGATEFAWSAWINVRVILLSWLDGIHSAWLELNDETNYLFEGKNNNNR